MTPPTCRYCHTAIHDGNTCVECARDRWWLNRERDEEWWT